jgi:hypothetical protein
MRAIDYPQKKLDELAAMSTLDLIRRARTEIISLCSGEKRWTMSVPVNAERDSDVLFAEVVDRLERLEQEANDDSD